MKLEWMKPLCERDQCQYGGQTTYSRTLQRYHEVKVKYLGGSPDDWTLTHICDGSFVGDGNGDVKTGPMLKPGGIEGCPITRFGGSGFGLSGFGSLGFVLSGFELSGFGLVGFGLVGFGLVGSGLVGSVL